VQLTAELVQITAAGTRSLGRSFRTDMRAGQAGGGNLGIDQTGIVRIETRLEQVERDSLVLRIVITDVKSDRILSAQSLPLADHQEAIVEVATAVSGGSRLAIRFVPAIVGSDDVQDYPIVLPEFGIADSILMRNDKEVLLRISGHARLADLSGNTLQFFTLEGPRLGKLYISYRPFPGASLCGYIEGKRMLFQWAGNKYEWLASDRPILPDGRWAVYCRQLGQGLRGGGGGSAATAGFTIGELKSLENAELHDGRSSPAAERADSGKKAPGKVETWQGELVYPVDMVHEPQAINTPRPRYTPEARAHKIEGTIIMEAIIGADGSVRDVKILKGIGYGLDESAVETIKRQWLFRPATYEGRPVNVRCSIEVTFRVT
jgi:TonB family protein